MNITAPEIDTASFKTLNALLRGEISAIETYTQAIEKFTDETAATLLHGLREEHRRNASVLRRTLIGCGVEPATGSGLWGDFAQTVEGVATMLGESPALRILQQGEEHGIGEYEDALKSSHLCTHAKTLIRTQLLPLLHHHVIELKQHRDDISRNGSCQDHSGPSGPRKTHAMSNLL